MIHVVYGAVTVATPAGSPTVKLDGEVSAAPCPNYAAGYVPVVGNRVCVLVTGGDRIVIGVKQ